MLTFHSILHSRSTLRVQCGLLAARQRVGRPGFRIPAEVIVLYSKTSRPALGPTQPPTQWVPGTFLGLKQSKTDSDHSHACRPEFNEWSHTPAPPIRLYVVDKDKFTFFTLHTSLQLNLFTSFSPLYLWLTHTNTKTFSIFSRKADKKKYGEK